MADNPEAGIERYGEHDKAVMRRINRFIALVNTKWASSTIAEKLKSALSDNSRDLEMDATHSQDSAGRDATLYFSSRHSVAALHGAFNTRTSSSSSASTSSSSSSASTSSSMRPPVVLQATTSSAASPAHSKAPVKVSEWEQRGAADGKVDLGSQVAPALFHHPK